MLAVIVCIAGLIFYLATDGKPSDMGRIMFAIGLAFVLWFYGGTRLL